VVRRYRAPVRAARATASRDAILAAALELFARDGYTATTLTGIADEAGLSVETIYKHFGNKTALLQNLLERSLDVGSGTGPDSLTTMADAVAGRFAAMTDPTERLRAHCSYARHQLERTATIQRIFAEAAGADPDLRRQWQANRQQRLAAVHTLFTGYEVEGVLQLPLEEAAQLAWTVAGPEVYTNLVHECGWSPDRYEDWLFTTLRQQILI
jgi:AcrR family transcriptional regulator